MTMDALTRRGHAALGRAAMFLTIERCPAPRCLRIGGELDLATAPELARVLGTISSGGNITLDLRTLRFIDLAGLTVLHRTAYRLQGSLILDNPPRNLLRLMELCRVESPPNVVLVLPEAPGQVITGA